MKEKFYSIRHLIEQHPDAHYYVVYGERSNGKTYSTLDFCIDEYFKKGYQFAYVRRWKEDIKLSNLQKLFDGILRDHKIEKYSHGKWTGILYKSRMFYFTRYETRVDDKGKKTNVKIVDDQPFCYVYVLTDDEHDKGFESPMIYNILFDEFIARGSYIPDEFTRFMGVISTIKRRRTGIKVFMLGNTINRYSLYFNEMGLTNIKIQKPDTIDVYKYGDSGLKVVCEYAVMEKRNKETDVYFAFKNPKLQMITNGAWELAIYPHLTPDMKYKPKHIKYKYFIEFDGTTLECDVVLLPKSIEDKRYHNMLFTFVHLKTSTIKEDNKNLVYSLSPNPKPNYRRNILKPFSKLEKLISDMYYKDKVFYQSNDIGDVVRNYMLMCSSIHKY